MTGLDDHELLAEYARTASEAAFAALVTRYVNLVHSAARRFTGNPHHAQEITQAVFIILARKARSLRHGTVLSGWLYQTARLTAANFVKGEIRRQHREQEAYMQSTLTEPDSAAWEQVAPLLDEAMGRLGNTDRNAVVLRFFENKSAQEIATALKLNEAAAHKRVNRAVDKLRKFFSQRGVTLSTAVLGGTVAANSVQAAPVGLAATISATTVKGAAVAASVTALVNGTIKLMSYAKFKLSLGISVGIVLAGVTITLALPKTEVDNKSTAAFAEAEQVQPVETPTPGQNPNRLTDNDTDNLSATNILTAVQRAYAALSTYRDTGRTIHNWGDAVWTNAFSLHLGRTNYYHIELVNPLTSTVTVYWSAGDGNYRSSLMHSGRSTPHESTVTGFDLAGNLSQTTDNTIVPTVFFNLNWANYITYLNGLRRKSVSRQPDEKIGEVDCYVLVQTYILAQTNSSIQLTLWVGKRDFLIRCLRRISTREAMLEAQQRSPNPSSLPPEKVRDQTTIEIHENIFVNETLNPEDFAHAALTNSQSSEKRP